MNAIQHTSTHGRPTLAPAPGVTPPEGGASAHRFLSDALVARGLVSQAQMDAALDASRAGQRYSQILVAEGAISEDDLARTLANHYRIDHVDLDVFPIEPQAAQLVSRETARRLGALPIALLPNGDVAVAVHDPEALTHLGELGALLRRDIRPVVASRSQVDRYIADPAAEPPAVDVAAAAAAAPVEPEPAPAPAEPAPVALVPVAPIPVAPISVAPIPVATEPVATAPVVPAPLASAPEPSHLEPAAPAPIALAPAAPEASAPATLAAEPVTPEPTLPEPAREPAAPAPITPETLAPQSVRPEPTLPEPERIALAPAAPEELAAPPAIEPEPTHPPPGIVQAPDNRPPEHGAVRVTDLRDPSEHEAAAGVGRPAAAVRELEEALQAAEQRIREAERRARDAEQRATAAESQARFADDRARAAEKHAEGMSAAAQAANEALTQLAQARVVSDQAAQAAALRIENLTSELETERVERRRLEEELQRRGGGEPAPVHELHPELRAPAPVAAPPAAAPAPPSPAPAPPPWTPGPPPPLRSVPPMQGGLAPEPAPPTEKQRKARGLRRMIEALKRS